MLYYVHNQKHFNVGSCTTKLCKCAAIINSEASLLFYVSKNRSIWKLHFLNMLLGRYTEFPFLDSSRLYMLYQLPNNDFLHRKQSNMWNRKMRIFYHQTSLSAVIFCVLRIPQSCSAVSNECMFCTIHSCSFPVQGFSLVGTYVRGLNLFPQY